LLTISVREGLGIGDLEGLYNCEGLKLDLNSIKLGHKLCIKSLEKERQESNRSSRIAKEVVYRAVAE
jgi:hypothetical protein